ncbi:MAG: L-2-amino-thiazoline-4-carboxylic acid hydrolase [Promethearchaeota archaeon]
MKKTKQHIDARTKAERSRIEDRALWLYFIFKEIENEFGIKKAEAITRRAIWKYGELKDDRVGNPKTPEEFIEKHVKSSNPEVFEKEIPETRSPDEKLFRMHYCALKNAWEKIDASEQYIDLLCDIAMDGDRARGKSGLEIEVTKRMCDLVNKPDYCEVVIRYRKEQA